ncbi:hypothetical protein ACIOD0_07775 [Kitasatospora albolonga]|uniref:Uncharacterized protein n=2 Tax=Streptomycetaceae TaxID=2062 RepID=A0ABU2W699_9ACTN|nr:hypothetical protein [Streptomyces griseus]ARF73967.1 hypothetical protein B7C62_18170 [Kitasatospora albolonga]MDT0493386.1 hypothetical protein [Streptomyces griseus]
MPWEEWEQLKQDASQRQEGGTEPGEQTGMRLNQLPPEDRPGTGPATGAGTSSVTGGVKSTKKAWNDAGAGVGALREPLDKAVGKLRDGQQGLGADDGCLTAGAQKTVHTSWDRYVKDLGKRCGSVKGILEKTGHDLLLTDQAVVGEFGKIKTEYADTPGLGGKSAGR